MELNLKTQPNKLISLFRVSLMFFLFFFAQQTVASSQSITLPSHNITIKDAFTEIEKQTGMSVDYDESVINLNKRVNASINNKSLNEALALILKESGCTFVIKNNHIIISAQTVQQQKKQVTVSGTVSDNLGPIVGANVVEKGTTNGIITDMDGNYTLSVSEGAVLQFSYIGYITKEITVGNQKNINVQLAEDAQKLEEVVVVGYGTAKKSDLAGSVVRADLGTLQESPSISLGSALQGTVPGLNVGAVSEAGKDPEMSIRGRTSISGGNSPLIVLDGIIFRGNMVDINMNDVESIDILKDASAAAIYGSEASNGVILITSKQGKVMSKPMIEYSGSYSFQAPTNKNMYPEDRDGFLRKIADRYLEESRIGDDMLTMNPDWDPSRHLMDNNTLEGYNNGTNTNWWDLILNDNPYIQNHNLSVRGKSELSGYYLSVGYTDQQNLIINDTYKRYNVRINLDTKITDWLKVGTQSFFAMSDYSGASPSLSTAMQMPPLSACYDENGNLIKQPYKTGNNPLQTIDQDDVNRRYNLFGNFFVDIDFPFLKGLNYRLNFSQNLIHDQEFNFDEWGDNFTGKGKKMNATTYNYTVDNILTYKNTFGKHDINATFVYGLEKRQYESTTAEASHFSNFALGYNSLQQGQSDLNKASSSAWEESSLYMMFRAAYTYDNKYIFTGTVRRDGFSGFGANNKYGVFPSAAIAWRINEEDFFKDNINWVDNLKLRLSYGQNGNRTVGRYQTLAKMGTGNGYLFGDGASAEQMQWLSSLANADLKWETTNTFNIAADFSTLNSRIFGTLEYYTSTTNNVLYNINIPQMNGLSSIPSNIGKLGNHGFEMTVTGVPVETKDFSWDITFNFSRNRNKVKSIFGIDADGDGREDDLIANKIFIDRPYGVCYDYNIIGMWQIADKLAGKIPNGFEYGTYKVEDINGDGKYDKNNDRKILGYTDPAYRFSIQNSFRYKDWEFKFMINSVQGGKNYYYGQPGSSFGNNTPDNIYQNNCFNFDYWTPENPNARYRQLGFFSEALGYNFHPYVQRNFVRLQDVTLSYNVPKSFLQKFNINRLKLYVTGKNLLTFTDWDGWDPESGAGLSVNSYPVMKSYSIGLNVEF